MQSILKTLERSVVKKCFLNFVLCCVYQAFWKTEASLPDLVFPLRSQPLGLVSAEHILQVGGNWDGLTRAYLTLSPRKVMAS